MIAQPSWRNSPTRFSEALRFVGRDSAGNLLEMWVSPSGSFTALLTPPEGLTCIVSAGNAGGILPGGQKT